MINYKKIYLKDKMNELGIDSSESAIYNKLKTIYEEIRESWHRDCDRTEYMLELINILKEILTKETLEEYFLNNEKLVSSFMGDFLQDVINNILIQPIIYGEKGDEIALNLLWHIFKLFLKFHKNTKYAPMFEKIRSIFQFDQGSKSFFTSHKHDEKKYDFNYFNLKYCSKFEKNIKKRKFKKGEEVDINIELNASDNIRKNAWVRGRIKDIENDEYVIEFCEMNDVNVPINGFNIVEKGSKTTDWDWRTNLKKYDVIDCYDRCRWYPATVLDVEEIENNGFKKIAYKIAFRLYPEHFKNPEDENDTYDKHIDIWKRNHSEVEFKTDDDNEKYIGDMDNCSETILFYSKRIQKFNTYSACQQKNLEYTYSYGYGSVGEEDKNPMRIMNDKLVNDTNIYMDDYYYYEKNGKKNVVLAKSKDCYYYFALLLKILEKEGVFTQFMEILQDQPNSEEMFNVFSFLTCMFPYLHKDYFIENYEIIKNSLINFINNLNEKEMRNMPKNLNGIVSNLLIMLIENKDEDPNKKKFLTDLYDEVTISFSIKTIKTNIFDRRLQGIKALNEYIERNQKNKKDMDIIIDLLKKNDIITEIFGANYHSQIIGRSKEIVKLLLIENQLSEDDIKLIWSCTKKGDLEAKLTILQLLSELAPNLKENYIEMLLDNIRTNVDTKHNKEEIELVYKLSTQGQNNEKNIGYCCDYLCQCLLVSNDPNIGNSPILEKLFEIIEKDNKYLKKVFDICENSIKKNERTILSYAILFEIMDKINCETNGLIQDFIQDRHLLNLFEDNFKLYIKQTKDSLAKVDIDSSDAENIDKYIVDGFTHAENVKKRMEIYPYLVNKFYLDYDFLPFLKESLITNAVSPNDQSIFYDFVKSFIDSNDNNDNIDAITRKEKIREELFVLISENNQTDITVEQLELFISLFFDMNKGIIKLKEENFSSGMDYEIKEVENIDEIKGLDKLWNIIFQLKKEKVLSVAINIIFQIYKNKYIEKLLEKCSNLIKEDKATSETIEKCIILLKLIIIESEKNCVFKPKSHLSLLKNCLIKLPLEIKGKKKDDEFNNILLYGNTTVNELKIIISKIYNIPPQTVSIDYSRKYLKYLKKNNLVENDEIDESNNNSSLYDLIIEKNNNIEKSNLEPEDKLAFDTNKSKKEKLLINGEMNPKLVTALKDKYNEFTEGTGKMDRQGTFNFIKCVLNLSSDIDSNEKKIKDFMARDKDQRGYVSEEEFIEFYRQSLNLKEKVVWENLERMGIREDLRKKNDPFEIIYVENEKLPRYKLGNDLSFINNLIQKYYKNQNTNASLIDFLLHLTTNGNIYFDVLDNLFNSDEANNNKDSFISKALNDSNNYAELNYIFIIIESIFQDLEISLYNKYIDTNDFIIFNGSQYKIVSEKYEPFDDENMTEKKLNFVKNLMKEQNLQKLIKLINNLLELLIKENNDSINGNKVCKLYETCLRGLKLINIINNFNSDVEKENINCLQDLKEKGIYNLGFCNLTLLFNDINIKEDLDKISYLDLSNILINYLNSSQKIENAQEKEKTKDKENDNSLQKECLDLLINLLSSNKRLLNEYTSKDETKKQIMTDLFKNNFSGEESANKTYFIQNIIQSINKAKSTNNIDYIKFLFQIINSLLDNLIGSQTDTEGDKPSDKIVFTPDNKFFELYNNLYKIMSELKGNNNGETADEKENANVLKVYELIMKNIQKIEDGQKIDFKIFISLLQLLKTQINENDKLKNTILFKETEGKTLFNYLLQKSISNLKKEVNKEESLISTDNNNDNTGEKEDNKFICLDNIKEEKKDDSSDEELIEISNEFILNCLEGTKDPKLIAELLKILSFLKNTINKNGNADNDDDDKNGIIHSSYQSYNTKSCDHVGLKNLGCICYMNSIMQQIYMVPTFRYAIMSADDGESPNPSSSYNYSIDDDNLLHQLQKMFTYLTFSNKMDYNPKDFCFSYKDFDGSPINVRTQQDSQEFYNNLCDKIENSLKKTKYKYIVSDVFTGKTCSTVLCENCKHISYRFEDYYNLTLEVKNINNLKDSLNKLNVPEIIDDFKCSNCEQKVRINKVTSLNKLPNVLVVHLKRFYLNYETCYTEKINSKFEFPTKLNLKHFCVEEVIKNLPKSTDNGKNENENKDAALDIYSREDEYYEYELKGINVHTGTADGGHYFSFIDVNRDGKNNKIDEKTKGNWLQFNDSHVSTFDTDTIPNECYGGSIGGRHYENCQNAYLLIYERKKKSPIKIIIDEKDIDKEKEKDNIIKINKDNRSQINKEYDLSRLNNDIKEEDLYKKIFMDEEKNEYYKYIPYYSIPKYAPRKVYDEIIKENNTSESSNDSGDAKTNTRYKKYKGILISTINNKLLDISNDNYNDLCKETALSIVLNEFFKNINKNDNYNASEKNEINDLFKYIINNLIKPLVKEETNVNLLKTVIKLLNQDNNLSKIFKDENPRESDNVFTDENAKEIGDILYNIIIISLDKISDIRELSVLFLSLLKIVKNSKTDYFEEKCNIIYLFELFHKLIFGNEKVLKYLIEKDMIIHLLKKINDQNKIIRNIIYDMVIYMIKKTKEYKKELFDFEENEKEGEYDFDKKEKIVEFFQGGVKQVFTEKNDLLIMLLKISAYDNFRLTKELFYKLIYNLYETCLNDNNINAFLDVMLSLVTINDSSVFERFYNILGYPNLIIKQIPRIKKKRIRSNNYDSDDDDDNDNRNDSDKENKNEETENVKPKQKWPLFGERLINGNIKRHIYEYLSINHRENGFCLLGLLFPNDDKDDETKEKNDKKDEKNDDDKNEDTENKKLNITNEVKKNVILYIFKQCFGEKSNYPLFKYIYLMPARSLLYKNLYEEMKQFIKEEDKSINLENYEIKEQKYIKHIEKEVNETIKKYKDKENNKRNNGYYDNDNDDDQECPDIVKDDFKCFDNNMKQFIGFVSDIVPGEIVREEIVRIAHKNRLAMYRIQYFTKYFKFEELRNKLLNNKEQNENKVEKKEKENKTEDNKEEKLKEDKEDNKEEKKEEKKEENKKEEKEEKENEGKKEEENKQTDNVNQESQEEKEGKKEESEKKECEDEKKEKQEKKEDNKEEKKNNESESDKKDKKEDNNKEDEEDNEEVTETDIDDSLERKYNCQKYDVSEKNENDFIYQQTSYSIILEDKTQKNKNKVKSILHRFIFTNMENQKKYFGAKIKSDNVKKIYKINTFLPPCINDTLSSDDITNFYNAVRLRSDLPFLERDDAGVSIDMGKELCY